MRRYIKIYSMNKEHKSKTAIKVSIAMILKLGSLTILKLFIYLRNIILLQPKTDYGSCNQICMFN